MFHLPNLCTSTLVGAPALLLSLGLASTANAALVFSEDFNSFTSTNLGTQDASGLTVGNQGSLSGWSGVGAGGIHAVDHTGTGNWALQLYNGYNTSGTQHILTTTAGIAANDIGETYTVTFDLGATIYEHFSQGTSASDGVVVQILRGNNSVLSSQTIFPGNWVGVQTFASESFQYIGDGSGAINLQINSLVIGDNLLSGAIDNIEINTSTVPIPAAAWLFGSTLAGLTVLKRSRS